MSNYHFEVTIISRGKGRSVTSSVSYISGRALHDIHNGKTYYKHREDLAWQKIFLPDHAPAEFPQLQHLCDEIECAEMRWDARTGRQLTASLPNELPLGELVRIVHEFVADNFTSQGLCTVAAIHRKHNHHDPKKNNPHVHMIVLSLGFKALMTDLNVQSVSFVGSILNRCPLLPPDGNVFSFIVFPVL